ncbi:MAG: histidinol-phosphate aminotransferase family protein [Candidatus Methanomethylophilaceae archaeon]|nr:histidinol-phosphate aminotransferase family protein [Candidatus Methanomethylophilaceae archaeon]
MKGRILPRGALSDLPKTVHGGQAWKLEGIEDYSHNLNPFGPPEEISEIIMQAVSDLGHYPDDSCTELKETISRAFNIDPDCITIGAGSSDIIRNVPNTFFSPGDRVVLNRPSFAEYSQQCRIVGADIVWNDLLPENDFRIDLDSLMVNVGDDTRALYICNPNNPTGRVEPRDKIVSIVRECEERGVLVFLDETLLELVPGYMDITLSGMVDRFTNLIVASSLTKSFAIPGIRIGFGMSNPDIISEMEKVRMTWNVGQIEQVVANVLLRDHMDYVDHAAAVMAVESEVLNSSLREIGFPVGSVSDSFFYFNSLEPLGMDSPTFKRKMLAQGIMVRDCSSFGDEFRGYVRYSVKDRERNCRFIAAVDSVING